MRPVSLSVPLMVWPRTTLSGIPKPLNTELDSTKEPSPPCRLLKNGRCNTSDTVIGILKAITGCGPAPPEVGTYRNPAHAITIPIK
ncbi:hypothetical protein AVEN_67743-1 [Araneus ventricosus]|uniref:Uncharacterized protein n=1 Tax=Araneus ventricosus TaxID=182803 RepID=A0A4Y2C0S2_ARAVE|nr:hypothetical protein AVEN_67743-1 [Araneus ventricosus]